MEQRVAVAVVHARRARQVARQAVVDRTEKVVAVSDPRLPPPQKCPKQKKRKQYRSGACHPS